MRTCCGYQYDPAQTQSLPLDFHGPSEAHQTRPKGHALPADNVLRQLTCFRTLHQSTRKDISFRNLCRRLQVHSRRRLHCAVSRNINLAPFRPMGHKCPIEAVKQRLRIDSPGSNCCSPGTFPHFSLQSSHLNICYYHQDLH